MTMATAVAVGTPLPTTCRFNRWTIFLPFPSLPLLCCIVNSLFACKNEPTRGEEGERRPQEQWEMGCWAAVSPLAATISRSLSLSCSPQCWCYLFNCVISSVNIAIARCVYAPASQFNFGATGGGGGGGGGPCGSLVPLTAVSVASNCVPNYSNHWLLSPSLSLSLSLSLSTVRPLLHSTDTHFVWLQCICHAPSGSLNTHTYIHTHTVPAFSFPFRFVHFLSSPNWSHFSSVAAQECYRHWVLIVYLLVHLFDLSSRAAAASLLASSTCSNVFFVCGHWCAPKYKRTASLSLLALCLSVCLCNCVPPPQVITLICCALCLLGANEAHVSAQWAATVAAAPLIGDTINRLIKLHGGNHFLCLPILKL